MTEKKGMTEVKDLSGSDIADHLYTRLPNGLVLNHNDIYDVIDRIIITRRKKDDPFHSQKRYLYQYKDAARDRDTVLERYERIAVSAMYTDQIVMKDPTSRLSIVESYAKECPPVRRLLVRAERKCAKAKYNVAEAICRLDKKKQRLVLTAHYVCGADLKWISAVYNHTPYWAKVVRDKALKNIDCEPDEHENSSCIEELDQLIEKWTEAEEKYRDSLGRELPHQSLDDRLMLMGLI